MESGVQHDPRFLRFFFEVFVGACHASVTPLHDDWKCEAIPHGLLSEDDIISFDTKLHNIKRPLTKDEFQAILTLTNAARAPVPEEAGCDEK